MFFKKAVLVIHGFGGGTWENEHLVNYLKFYDNYDVYDFTLPRHQKEIINNVKHEEWIEESEKQLVRLLTKYHTIYLVGHSMGGVIASYLAIKYKEVKKLVLVAPAFGYLNFNQTKKDFQNSFKKKTFKSNFNEQIYNGIIPKIIKLPLKTMIEFTKLVKGYRNYAIDIKCPVLIIHGDGDELIPLNSVLDIYTKINNADKYFTLIRGGRHRILNSDRKEEFSEYISYFLKGGLTWKKKYKSEI